MPNKQPDNAALQWTGLAFQMMAVIGGSVWLGLKIDAYLTWKVPLFTIVLSLTGIGLSIFFVIKKVNRYNDE